MVKRLEPKERQGQILEAAIDVAKKDGYHNLTRDRVADKAGVSYGLVSHYFGDVQRLRDMVMHAAVDRCIPRIVAEGLVLGDAIAKSAPAALKEQAAALISA